MKSDLPLASLTILRRHKLFHVSVMGHVVKELTELAAQVSGRRNLLEINHDVSSAILFRLWGVKLMTCISSRYFALKTLPGSWLQ